MKVLYQSGKEKVYLRFNQLHNFNEETPEPFVSFVFGVELDTNTWYGENVCYKAEDAFVMCGDDYEEFLKTLKEQINNYKETSFEINDCWVNTNAKITIDCQKSMIVLNGCLGSSLVEGLPVLNFSLRNLDSSFLINLYEALIENTKFEC